MQDQTKPPEPAASPAPASTVMADIMKQVHEANAFSAVETPPLQKLAAQEPATPEPKPKAPKTASEKPPVVVTAPPSLGLPDPTADDPKPSAQDTDEDAPPEGMEEKSKGHWNAIRESKKLLKSELATVRQKLQERESSAQSSDAWLKEKESLVKEREDLLKRIQTANIERDPRFQAYFDGREKFLVEQAKKIGGENGAHLAAIIKMPEGAAKTQALEEVLGALPVSSQARVGGIINEMERLHLEKEAELAKASETHRTMQEQQVAQHREHVARATAQFNATLDKWGDPQKGLPVFQTRENDPEWNSQVEATRANAKHIFAGEMSFEEKMRASIWAAAAPRLLGELKATQGEMQEMKKELARLKTAQPSTGATGQTGTDIGDEADEKLPLHQRIAKMARNQGAFANR